MIAIPSNPSDVRITPQGMLRDEPHPAQLGNGLFLLSLIENKIPDSTPGKLYFRTLFSNYLRKLATLCEPSGSDLSAFYQQARPNESETSFQVLSAPPITGAEYFDAGLLCRFYQEFEETLQERFTASQGTFTEFMRSLSPAWKDVGKVAFHLAENKGDSIGNLPFAFMASFIWRADGDKPKHLPLAAALKAYAGQTQALETLLAPNPERRQQKPPDPATAGKPADFSVGGLEQPGSLCFPAGHPAFRRSQYCRTHRQSLENDAGKSQSLGHSRCREKRPVLSRCPAEFFGRSFAWWRDPDPC